MAHHKALPFDIELMQQLGREAGLEAIARLNAKGIPAFGKENGKLVAQMPDGTRRIVTEEEARELLRNCHPTA